MARLRDRLSHSVNAAAEMHTLDRGRPSAPDALGAGRWAAQAAMVAVLLLCTGAAGAPTFRTPEIWLAPLQPVVRPNGVRAGAADFGELFTPGSPWNSVGAQVSVFKLYPTVVRDWPDARLREILDALASRRIALALEAPILVETSTCSPNAAKIPWMVGLVKRLKSLGADLRYFAMDGPLVAGHTSVKLGACHAPIETVIEDVAHTVTEIKALYPGIVIGEIEPVGHRGDYPDWRELKIWLDAFAKATKSPLGFFHLDVTWGLPWRDDLLDVSRRIRASGIPFGVIYNSEGSETSDAEYARASLMHANEVETVLAGRPDQVIFQSWADHPSRALPESIGTTMTGVLRDYLRPETHFVGAAGTGFSLVGSSGTPIAGADIEVNQYDPTPGRAVADRVFTGIVPEGAASALFGLRIHVECDCKTSKAEFLLTQPIFIADNAGASKSQIDLSAWPKQWPEIVKQKSESGLYLDINVPDGKPVLLNGPAFPVISGESFSVLYGVQAGPSSEGAGIAALIFIGRDGRELRRLSQPLSASWRAAGHILSSPSGQVNVPAPHASGVRWIRYFGDARHRPVDAEFDTVQGLNTSK